MSELDPPVAAAIFDLDGTLTHTVDLHEACWQEVFDTLFVLRMRHSGAWQRPFDTADYRAFVDGRPRRDGIRALLDSRGIDLPDGTDDDAPGSEAVAGIGNLQRQLFLERLETTGAAVDFDALRLLNGLRAMGAGIALASVDDDAENILWRVGLSVDLFDAARFEAHGSAEHLAPKAGATCLSRVHREAGDRGRTPGRGLR